MTQNIFAFSDSRFVTSSLRIAMGGFGKLTPMQKVEQQKKRPRPCRCRGRAKPKILNQTTAFCDGCWETEAACLGAIISVGPIAFRIAFYEN